MHLDFIPADIEGLFVIGRERLCDKRGHFSRLFCTEELQAHGLNFRIRQINRSHTKNAGTIRGMHFQTPPHEEAKIVTCMNGSIFDVAIDLRPASSSFGQWRSVVLNGARGKSYFIPKGFAHGFQTLEDNCEILYLHDADYDPSADAGINPLDTTLSIDWPMPPALISEKDQALPGFDSLKSDDDAV